MLGGREEGEGGGLAGGVRKGGGGWARGGRPRGEILPKSLKRQAHISICKKHFLLNFGRAIGGGRGGPGRRWEERGGGWARGGEA